MITCPKCSKKNPENSKHCGFCGAKLRGRATKQTIWGMNAIAPDELERLRSEAKSRDAMPAVGIEAPKVESEAPKAESKAPKAESAAKSKPKHQSFEESLDDGWDLDGDGWDLDGDEPGEGTLSDTTPDDLAETMDAGAVGSAIFKSRRRDSSNDALADTVDAPKALIPETPAAEEPAPRVEAASSAEVEPAAAVGAEPEAQEPVAAEVELGPEPEKAAVAEPEPEEPVADDPALVTTLDSRKKTMLGFGPEALTPASDVARSPEVAGEEAPRAQADVEVDSIDTEGTDDDTTSPTIPHVAAVPAQKTMLGLGPEARAAAATKQVAEAEGAEKGSVSQTPNRSPDKRPSPTRRLPVRVPNAPPEEERSSLTYIVIGALVMIVVAAAVVGVGMMFFGDGDKGSGKKKAPKVESSVTVDAFKLAVTLPPEFEGAAIRIDAQRQRPEVGVPAQFEFDTDILEVGSNILDMWIEPEGAEPTRFPVSLFLPARVTHDLAAWERGEPTYHLRFEVPTESELKVGGKLVDQPPEETIEGRRTFRVAVDMREQLKEASDEAVRRHAVYYTVTAPYRGKDVLAEGRYFVTLEMPRTLLVLTAPPPGWVQTRAEVLVRGLTDPDADLTIEGQRVSAAVENDGRFRFKIKIPTGESDIQVIANRAGALPMRQSVRVRRTSARERAALNLEQKARADAFRLKRAPADIKPGDGSVGEAVQLQGALKGFLVDRSRAILLVEACGRRACLVAVEATGWLPVELGARIAAVGESVAAREFEVSGLRGRSAKAGVQRLPVIRSEIVYAL